MKDEKKALAYIGFARKSRQLVSGEFAVENAVKQNKAVVVVLASDASDNTKKKFRNMTENRGIPLFFVADKARLGRALGTEIRASLAVTGRELGEAVINALSEKKDRGGDE